MTRASSALVIRPKLAGDATLGARIAEVDRVQRVEELGTELNVHVVRQSEVLEEPRIHCRVPRPEKLATLRLAERAVRVHGETGRVEPHGLCPIPAGGSNGCPVYIARLLPNPSPRYLLPLGIVIGSPLCR